MAVWLWWILINFLLRFHSVRTTATNVALGKPATQTEDVTYAGWTWSADKAVDNCTDADNPDDQECCSTSMTTQGQSENLWRVDLLRQYNIERIDIVGRSDTESQLQDFQLFYESGGSETLIYDNNGVAYGNGFFTIPINPVIVARHIIIRRPSVLTLCEVQVFGVLPSTETNVALNKPARQSDNSSYNGWTWTADYAVDGCILADDPDNQQCCSTSLMFESENFWRVDLLQMYTVVRIVVIGRSDTDNQLTGFQMYYQDGSSEIQLYDNTGVEYETGRFEIPVVPARTTDAIIIRRNDYLLTLCEVEVYGTLVADTSTSSTPSTSSTSASAATTTSTQATATNVALGKYANQTEDTTYNGWTWSADKAVDNCTDADMPDDQECCSTSLPTMGQPENIWSVYLLALYDIESITIIGRSDGQGPDQLSGFQLFYDVVSPQTLLNDNTGVEYGSGVFTIPISPVVTASAIIIRRPTLLTLCEVQVYGTPASDNGASSTPTTSPTTSASAGCTDGFWGPSCSESCGRCQFETACDRVTGDCRFGCQTNWMPPRCDVCVDGNYGPTCQQSCGQCSGGAACDKFNGICLGGCDPGWEIPRCDSLCSSGTYGQDCAETCGNCDGSAPCDAIDGSCSTGCAPGWIGGTCSQSCSIGFYGYGCSLSCGNCAFGGPCNVVDGICPSGCDDGWTGATCHESLTTTTQATETSTKTTHASDTIATNIALRKYANQTEDVTWNGWVWSADKAVDDCTDADMPDDQKCCSTSQTTQGQSENIWSVYLLAMYNIERIIVIGRSDSLGSGQLSDFQIFYDVVSPQTLLYDNIRVDYGPGVFTIPIDPAVTASVIIVRRPAVLTLCEVQVFGTPVSDTSTSSISTATSTPTPTSSTPTSPASTATNVALGKYANQTEDVTYNGWTWSADKAVDNCTDADMPDDQECCSTSLPTMGQPENIWSVYLLALYDIESITVIGRSDGEGSNQLGGFQLFYDVVSPQTLLYDNTGVEYVTGVFTIPVVPVVTASAIIIRRPDLLTLCEVQVYGTPASDSGTSSTPTPTQTPTTSGSTGCTDGFWGVSCGQSCGRCRFETACDRVTGECRFGCETGWEEPRCDTACSSGSYGQDCAETCGNCDGGAPCDAVDGTCSTGCAPGWIGGTCSQSCSVGFYGYGCSLSCGNCAFGGPCNIVDGVCPSGCDDGWTGSTCHEAVKTTTQVTATNVALRKYANQTEDVFWNEWLWSADKAVDGCTYADMPDDQECCSTSQPTMGQPENIWSVYLLALYDIESITIIGRSDGQGSEQLSDFQIYYDVVSPQTLLYDNTRVDYGSGVFTIPIAPVVTVSAIIVRRPGVLTLCEVEVYGTQVYGITVLKIVTWGAPASNTGTSSTSTPTPTSSTPTSSASTGCPDGFWGMSCRQSCGHCRFETVCDRVTGDCRFGCEAGWEEPRCDTACSGGSFGQDCAETCGNCDGGAPCDAVDGTCSTGCAPGWIGGTCSQSCPVGFYGYGCSLSCGNCAFGGPCNVVDGVCPSGCDDGWTGNTCHEAVTTTTQVTASTSTTQSAATNVALRKYANQTEDVFWNEWLWSADKAVDGCTDADMPDDQECCSTSQTTMGQPENIWSVYLQALYDIESITIIGRSDGQGSGQLSDFQIYYDVVSGPTLLYDNTGVDYGSGVFTIPISPVVTVSAIIIRRPSVLTLCEVQVYGTPASDTSTSSTSTSTPTPTSTSSTPTSTASTDCTPGFWGVSCLQPCGQCFGDASCDRISGNCATGCQTNWMPPRCDMCVDGVYGSSCQDQCGRCTAGVACDKTTGECPSDCEPGFTGPRCDASCTSGNFGQDCLESCGNCAGSVACNAVDGSCSTGCAPGWTGGTCHQGCPSGNYGQNCQQSCGNCNFGAVCNAVDGSCPTGCAPGWTGGTCNQGCTSGSYGQDCQESCGNCASSMVCDAVDGSCPSGCVPGWTGGTCHQGCQSGNYGQNCQQSCGNCAGGVACNTVDGSCPAGCAPGFTGGTCHQACTSGSYGQDCLQRCGHCAGGSACNTVDGSCPAGCAPGWTGGTCHQAVPSSSTVSSATGGSGTTQGSGTSSTSVSQGSGGTGSTNPGGNSTNSPTPQPQQSTSVFQPFYPGSAVKTLSTFVTMVIAVVTTIFNTRLL